MLLVAQDFPWPVVTGSLIRLTNVISALSEVGDLDLFCFVHSNRSDPCDVPADAAVSRILTATYTERAFTVERRLRWVLSDQPLQIAATDYREPHEKFWQWVHASYDLVWFSKAHTYEALGRPQLGPTVVDLDDLEDQKIRAFLAAGRDDHPKRSRLHDRGAQLQALLNIRRWRRLQQSIARSADAVAICSDLDATRLAAANATVVPNGYQEPEKPVGREDVGAPPIVLFAGLMFYPPNAYGARWLVREVLPHLQRLVPDLRLRLVGTADPLVQQLHAPPAVTVVGRVPDIVTELERADLVAVPIRFGSGTRVKILEAFSHRLPVVSTTIGAEGLDLESDRHLLIADTPEDFAAACARLLGDRGLRLRLVDEASRRFHERHRWALSRQVVLDLAYRHALPAGTPR